ncbi:MAG: CpsD/CapB family tyrosine-protein kinase [Candidatus Omnitrophica bacterium]|nr:CpsD/CapB family tyrosine-protein kinase [Candidatus Omnitrophota bacterium]
MGKITNALKKAAEERIQRIEKVSQIRERDKLIVKKIGESKVDPSIITYFDPKALISEQYKILRTNILSMNKGKPPKTFVITSSIHSEGKTITSLNLAMSLAQAVHKPRVLLVDADLRKGKVAKYLGTEPTIGLSEVLSGEAEAKDALFHVDIDNLALIQSGRVPEFPSELLASDSFKRFLNQMRGEFDHIIIDTPPIISVTDSGIVGAQTDGVILVIQAGRTQRGIVKRAEELLFQSHSKILGHVLTNIEYHLPEYIYRYL